MYSPNAQRYGEAICVLGAKLYSGRSRLLRRRPIKHIPGVPLPLVQDRPQPNQSIVTDDALDVRSNTKVELAAVEARLEALSRPSPPRRTESLVKALEVEKVPPSVGRDSHECASIHNNRYSQSACTEVLALRRELATARG